MPQWMFAMRSAFEHTFVNEVREPLVDQRPIPAQSSPLQRPHHIEICTCRTACSPPRPGDGDNGKESGWQGNQMTVSGTVGGVQAMITYDSDVPLKALWQCEYGPMMRLATLVAGSSARAEDIVQDAFAETVRRFDSLHNPGGYLRSAVVSLARRSVRSDQREDRRRARLRSVRSDEAYVHHDLELDDPVLGALNRLGDKPRTILILRYWACWSEAEIADALDCPVGTVKSGAARALAQLRKELQP
jgi:RNA polymerase sigma factor (sigma-70 family)